mgnify:CR=1 FL=1
MKQRTVSFLIFYIWLMATCVSVVGSPPIQVEEHMFREPYPLREIVSSRRPGTKSPSLRLTNSWYINHRDAQIVDVSPIIKDDALLGWNISWIKSSNPTRVSVPYIEMEAPFTLPVNVSTEAALRAVWKELSKHLRGYKSKPVALNKVTRDGVSTVYGIWTMAVTDTRTRFKSDGRVSTTVPDIERYRKYYESIENTKAPIPITALGLERKPRVPLNLEMDPDVVQMPPFKVAMKEWLEIRPTMNKDGTIRSMKIERVVPNSPVADAGVKAGGVLKAIQGVEISGLTNPELTARLAATPIIDELRLEVVETGLFGGKKTKVFVIPLKQAAKPATSSSVASK